MMHTWVIVADQRDLMRELEWMGQVCRIEDCVWKTGKAMTQDWNLLFPRASDFRRFKELSVGPTKRTFR